jgi:hypothetical protein
LRKLLIAATAALTVVACSTVAFAQTPGATMEVKVSPKNAGTKKRPANSSLRLEVTNGDTTRTMSRLTITSPATVKLATKGLPRCNAEELEQEGSLSVCPRRSRVGKGTASALVGVNTGTASPLTFDVTAVVTGPRNLGFYLEGRELPVNVLAPGRISGRKLVIEVPQSAQQPAPGTYAGLVSLQATMKGKKGKNRLISATGCKARKHAYKAVLTFIDNGVSPAGNVVTSASATCSK